MRAGVTVPGLRVVDVRQGVIGMEWIQGWSVREVLGGGQEGDELQVDEDEQEGGQGEEIGHENSLDEEEPDVQELLRSKGVDPGEFTR